MCEPELRLVAPCVDCNTQSLSDSSWLLLLCPPGAKHVHVTLTLSSVDTWRARLLPSAALVQRHVRSLVFKRSQKRFLFIVQTGAGLTVVDQDVAHQLHLPLLWSTETRQRQLNACHDGGATGNIRVIVKERVDPLLLWTGSRSARLWRSVFVIAVKLSDWRWTGDTCRGYILTSN